MIASRQPDLPPGNSAGRFVNNKLAPDQAEKKTSGRVVEPAQVSKAGCAERVFPRVPLEPGELNGRPAVIYAAGRLGKTSEFVNDPGWIKKGVGVAVVHGNRPVKTGDNCPARAAQHRFFLVLTSFL